MSGWPGSALDGLPFGRTNTVAKFEDLMFGTIRLEELAEQARAETRKNLSVSTPASIVGFPRTTRSGE
ncbi:MAG: hypothetical protein EBT57_04250 [Verrucomicrobia bacterium]|nr:hypothetical protein [Verrucomicrobiota bacterium]